jgi:hypothetical protein
LVWFARHSGQSFLEVLEWHPRDIDTWIQLDLQKASEDRMESARQELKRQMGRG